MGDTGAVADHDSNKSLKTRNVWRASATSDAECDSACLVEVEVPFIDRHSSFAIL